MKHQQFWEQFFPEFIHCQEPAIRSLIESASLISIPPGQMVFSPGNVCSSFILLLEGSVKAQLLSENGREIFLYQVLAGDSCVLTTSCLMSGDSYPAEAITETEVTAFSIPAQAFYRCLEKSAFFREFVFKHFALRLSNVIGRMDEVMFSDIDSRLAKTLLSFNHEVVKITHQALAAKLGTAREVVSRHLKQFEDKGWVNLSRGTITLLDNKQLKRIAGITA